MKSTKSLAKKTCVSFLLMLIPLSAWYGYHHYIQLKLVGFVMPEVRKIKPTSEYTLLYEGVLTDIHCGRINIYQTYGSYLLPSDACNKIITQIKNTPIFRSGHQKAAETLIKQCRFVSQREYPTYEYYTEQAGFSEKPNGNLDDVVGDREISLSIYSASRNVYDKKLNHMHISGINTGGSEFHLKQFHYDYPTYIWLSITAIGLLGVDKDSSYSYYDVHDVCNSATFQRRLFDPKSNSYLSIN